jgi:polysaccharide biosynthesis protein PslH
LKLLFVTPYLPSPPTFGGQRRLHGLMRELSKGHDVSVVSMFDPREDVREGKSATAAYCRSVTLVPNRRYTEGGAQKRLSQIGSLLSAKSYERTSYYERAMQAAIVRATREERFDLVQFEFMQMTSYAGNLHRGHDDGGPLLCLDEHNVEYDIVRRTAGAEVGLLRRAYSTVNWRKLRAEERRAWRIFDGTVLTSERDERLLLEDEPSARTAVVANGVDVDAFQPEKMVRPDSTVLFFGALNYYPNVDALQFFLREVWPLVKAGRPDARFRILGPKPPPAISSQTDPTVELVGYVDDVRPHVSRASVVIAPLRIGGGTRLKVLEAMALGKAIVSTTIGAEGIDVTHGKEILLADDARKFASEIESVIGDPGMADRLGRAARSLVVDRYSWHASTARLVDFYEELREERLRRASTSSSRMSANRGSRTR